MNTITLPRETADKILIELAWARYELVRDHYTRYPGRWARNLEELDRDIDTLEGAVGWRTSRSEVIPRSRALVRVEVAHA